LHFPYKFEQFQEILQAQAEGEYGCYAPNAPAGPEPRRSRRVAHLEPSSSVIAHKHTLKQLKDGFKQYETFTNISLNLMADREQHQDWVETLSQFTRCTSFLFGPVDYDLIGMDLQPIQPDCMTAPRAHGDHILLHCDPGRAAVMAEAFLGIMVECMSRAKCAIESLDLGQATLHDRLGWKDSLDLQKLDLSRLRHLVVEPFLPLYADDEDHIQMVQWMQDDIHFIFTEAADTLETFSCRRACSLGWHGTPIALPRLRRLTLGPCDMGASFFTAWLASLPSLEHIVLDRFSLKTQNLDFETPSNWKQVFDAMRNHTMLKRGQLSASDYDDNHEIFFDLEFDKQWEIPEFSRMEWVVKEATQDEIYSDYDIDDWIDMYICGHIEWRGALREAFEG
jgi:hypothetical protein